MKEGLQDLMGGGEEVGGAQRVKNNDSKCMVE
jgi:hypothetical protein